MRLLHVGRVRLEQCAACPRLTRAGKMRLGRFIVSLGQDTRQRANIVRWQMELRQQRVSDARDLASIRGRTLQSLLEREIDAIQAVELLRVDLEHAALDQLIAVRPLRRIDPQHELYDRPDVIRIVIWYPRVDPFAHALV